MKIIKTIMIGWAIIVALLLVATWADTAEAGPNNGSRHGGGSADATELVFKNSSGVVVGDSTLTYDGTTLKAEKFESADDDGDNAFVTRDNPTGYDTTPATGKVALFVENGEDRFRQRDDTGAKQRLALFATDDSSLEMMDATDTYKLTLKVPSGMNAAETFILGTKVVNIDATGTTTALTPADMRGSMNVCNGSASPCIFNLPPAVVGYHACFFTQTLDLLNINPDNSDKLLIKSALLDAGDAAAPTTGTIGFIACATAITTEIWVLEERSGNWVDVG